MIYFSIYRKETEKAEMVIECLVPRGSRRPLVIDTTWRKRNAPKTMESVQHNERIPHREGLP